MGTEELARPPVAWCGRDTLIQRTRVNRDFGTFDDPDAFDAAHGEDLPPLRAWLYARFVRHVLNRNVARIRAHGADAAGGEAVDRPRLTTCV